MAKKLICLLLIIPVIVMISLFAATKSISNMVDYPVSGISLSDETINLNLDKEETYTLDYVVYPINAKNKAVSISSSAVPERNEAKFESELVEDGKVAIKPLSPGSVYINVTTLDGAHTGTVRMNVTSNAITGIDGKIVDKDGNSINKLAVNEEASIHTTFEPKIPPDSSLVYESSNPNVATIDPATGKIKALRRGNVDFTVTSVFNPNFSYTLSLGIYSDYSLGLSGSNLVVGEGSKLEIDTDLDGFDISKLKYTAYVITTDKYNNEIKTPLASSDISFTLSGSVEEQNLALSYKFANENALGTYVVEILYEDELNPVSTSFTFNKAFDLSASFVDLGKNVTELFITPDFEKTNFINFPFEITPNDVKSLCTYSVTSDNTDVLITNDFVLNQGKISFKPLKPGVATITLTASYKGLVEASATLTVYVSPGESFGINNPNISFEEGNASTNPNNFDPHAFTRSPLEKVITLGKFEYSGNALLPTLTQDVESHRLVLNYAFTGSNTAAIDPSFISNLRWEAVIYDKNGNEAVTNDVYVNADGVVCFRDSTNALNDIVKFRLVFGSKENPQNTIAASYNIRCVSNAINVYSYYDLLRATTKNVDMSVVLRNHVSRDFGYYTNESGKTVPYYVTMPTTYDYRYAINEYGVGTDKFKNETEIKVLLEFRSNVYGNGHTINAHNLAYGYDATNNGLKDDALFDGPLDFVAMKGNGDYVGKAVSVKGQDNICFAVYNGVTLNNVSLKGSSLTPDANNQIELRHLDYSGTVVELLGENATIEYSRISSGRTVVRAFGTKDDPTAKINLDIKNSILSEAREFIIRAGSNRFVEGDYNNPAPSIQETVSDGYTAADKVDSSTAHNMKIGYSYSKLTENQQSYYDDNYINTFVTLENSVLKNTGLFAIGVDSHFASKALADGNELVYNDPQMNAIMRPFRINEKNKTSLIDTWDGLSKTSYGAKIKFVGRVDLCTWKHIDTVDSSSLIDIPSGLSGASGFAFLTSKLSFDVAAMIEDHISLQHPLIMDGKYVHGGIAFFGGGKNYGVFDASESTNAVLNGYVVGFGDLGAANMLKHAAGEEPFVFFMLDATSSFKYSHQLTNDESFVGQK